MQRFSKNSLGVESGSIVLFSDYQHDGEMWTGTGPREMRSFVTFSEPFLTVPHVTVGISMFDFDRQTNQRADIQASSVSETGFTIVFRTWADTRIARIRADWTAIGELADEDDWQVD